MATDNTVVISYPAGEDISALQNRFAKLDTDTQAIKCGNTEEAIGVFYNDVDTAGQGAAIAIGPIVRVCAGAAISTTGVDVMSDANGKAVTATGSGSFKLGKNLDIASGDGHIIRVLFRPNGKVA